MGSAFPLCRWPFPRLCGLPSPRGRQVQWACVILSSSFRLRLKSSLGKDLAGPGTARVPTPLMGFRLSSALPAAKVHLPRALPARYVPPPGFGYPLGGLLPSMPRRSCFIPTALVRFALRSIPLCQGIDGVSTATHPPTVCRNANSRWHTGRHAAVRFLGFAPCQSPWLHDMCLARRKLEAPMGFSLPGSPGRQP
jgi:hypothetical protein